MTNGRMLFDSSVWIDFLSIRKSHQAISLQKCLSEESPLYICKPIIQEVLQGIRDDSQYNEVENLIESLDILSEKGTKDVIGASKIYRFLRKKGITIRKPNDCLIAWYAINHDLILVHNDRDFDLIAAHTPLKIYQPT